MTPADGFDRFRDLYRRLLGLYPPAFRERYDFATSVPMAQQPRRNEWVGMMMNHVLQDLRYSFRMLLKNPVFTAAAVLTLALGIGLNAATFSAVNGILLRPLPGTREPERLVQLYRAWPGLDYGSTSIPHYQDLRDRTGDVFSDVGAWYFASISLAADGRSERIMGLLVSANFFQSYGVTPVLGRAFIPGEEDRNPGAHPVAVLGHGFWQARFGGDPSVVGRTLVINGHPFQIVGVAPEGFEGPVTFASIPLYVPLMMQMEIDPGRNLIEARGNNMMNVIARLRADVTPERAQQRLDALLLQLREELPDHYETQVGTQMVPQMEAGIHPMFRNAQIGMSAVMMAVVSLLLLIACVNVANLFLARARERRREMGIRLSLGAGRGRIMQQLLTESLVFSVLAGGAGLALAGVAVRFLSNFRPPMDGPWAFSVDMDNRVLLFTLAVSLAAGVLFGLAPALQATRADTISAVKGDTGGRSRSRVSNTLVVLQMALSLLLLISSGLFLRALQGATRIDPGFEDPAHIALAAVDPGLQGYDEARSRAFLDRLLQDVSALPEVRVAGLSNWVPLGLSSSDRGVEIPGYEFAEGERQSLHYALVTEGFLEAMGVELLEGRTFTRQDDAAGPPVIIVNQRFADRFWPGESALGKIVRTAGPDRQVVGVVETGKVLSLGEAPREMMYLPQRERFTSGMGVVARTSGDPQVVLRRIRELVQAADPDMPVFDVRTMEGHMGVALLPARLGGSVLGLFGVLGLVLAAVGIYGVMAYSVAQRTRELGIRIALGSNRGDVVKLVLREGLRLALLGVAIGLAAAAGAAQLVKGFLYGIQPLDPVAFTLVPLTLVAVAALAVYLPARRAAAVDPMRALKAE
ncbi:MAG: ABC transporter permease [Longimicrobiales bacterium]|nr:ABC transporter permease [Longimicrobiales bacterium]